MLYRAKMANTNFRDSCGGLMGLRLVGTGTQLRSETEQALTFCDFTEKKNFPSLGIFFAHL
jgi:hypothetical protein